MAVTLLKVDHEQAKRAIVVGLLADKVPALWSEVGTGKSTIIGDLAEEIKFQLFDVRLSDKEPADLGGIPVPGDNDTVHYLRPPMLPP